MQINIKYEDNDYTPSELELTRIDIAELIIRAHDQRINEKIGAHLLTCKQDICTDIHTIIANEQHETAHKIEGIFS